MIAPRILTPAEMRALETAAIDSGAVDGLTLMERAGGEAARVAGEIRPDGPIAILCGPGANGGDGYVIARRLAENGRNIRLFRLGDPESARGDAATARGRWLSSGGTEAPLSAAAERAVGATLIVDALFGTGLSRDVPDEAVAALEGARAAAETATVFAVDAPLGLSLDTGRGLPRPSPAHVTATFHAPKLGHVLEDGPAACGRLVTLDIGLAPFAAAAPQAARAVEGPTTPLSKAAAAHKYHHGHAIALVGGPGRGGAGRLAARAALRVGAGLATVGAPSDAIAENAARLDAIMLRAADDADDLRALIAEARANALVMGPGLGVSDRTARLLEAGAEASRDGLGLVLDADALTVIAREGRGWPGRWRDAFGERVVLTPHWGEFSRLFPDLAAEHAAADATRPDIVGLVRRAAAASGATVLLKGATTVIAAPDGDAALHCALGPRSAPWLATAGAGDVLAGLIGGLLARGGSAMAAAETAAWLHVEAARRVGPGLIAEDLPEAIPAVLRSLEE